MNVRLDGIVKSGGARELPLKLPQRMSKRAWLAVGTFQIREACYLMHRWYSYPLFARVLLS